MPVPHDLLHAELLRLLAEVDRLLQTMMTDGPYGHDGVLRRLDLHFAEIARLARRQTRLVHTLHSLGLPPDMLASTWESFRERRASVRGIDQLARRISRAVAELRKELGDTGEETVIGARRDPNKRAFTATASDHGVGASASPSPPLSAVASHENRHLVVRGPRAVARRQVFTVAARVDVVPGGDASGALAPIAIPPEGIRIALAVVDAPGALKLRGAQSGEVVVLPGQPSVEVVFTLEALVDGATDVRVRAHAAQVYLGDAVLRLKVSDAPHAGEQEVRNFTAARVPPQRHATLEVQYEDRLDAYRFQFRGPGIGLHPSEKRVTQPPHQIAQQVMAPLSALAKQKEKMAPEVAEALLRGIGTQLWDLLPQELQAQLIAQWDHITRLDIVSAADPVAWELLYCPDKQAFLVDHWLLTRWMYGDGAPLDVGDGPPAYVVPRKAPTSAASEVAQVRALYPSDDVWSSAQELVVGLDRAELGLLHVAAHNALDASNPLASRLVLDDSFMPVMVPPGRLRRKPLVFLNACGSAAATAGWTGPASWATSFLRGGAGAFIGSLWDVRDASASRFAVTFYEKLHGAATLGEAFRAARAAIDAAGDPTRFAYTLYGDADALLVTKGGDDA